ncbi:MAG: glycosyltransferase family 1 protein [Halioglobus sp.]|nr:glycosyltransferase family 1 protein [Halioglobus sp.]
MIYFDGSAILRSPDGVGRYAREIHARIPGAKLLTFSDVDDHGYDVVRLPFPRRPYQMMYRLAMPLAVDRFLREKAEVVVYPNFVCSPLLRRARCITVIHDLAYRDTPQYVSSGNRAYLSRHVPRSVAASDKLIAVSQTTRQQLLEAFDVAPDKVIVAPNAVDAGRFANIEQEDIDALRARHGIAGEYLLFVGTIEPRKNLRTLLDAYEKLGPRSPTLVLVGARGWKNRDIYTRVSGLQGAGFDIVVTGHVSEQELPLFYAGATLLVLPSHYEGFGIPILEAQAAGTAVITSRRAPMTEVAADAALFIDPDDADDIAGAIERLRGDGALRDTLQRKGRDNIRRYRWEDSARIVQGAIDELRR